MAQLKIGLKSRSLVKTLRWLKIRKEIQFQVLIASNFEPSQSFGSEKVSHLGVLTRDRDFEPI